MKNITYILIAISMSISTQLWSQDVAFSNPMLSPINLNPALTGVINSKNRLQMVYRNQYAFLGKASFNTFSAAYDRNFTIGKYDFIGAGISVLGDQAGDLNYQNNKISLTGSYIKRVGGARTKQCYLVAGAEVGAKRQSIDLTNAQWGNQHDGNGTFDPNIFQGLENFDNTSFTKLDMSIGLLFFLNDEHNGKNLYFGASYFHLNKTNQSFSSTNEFFPRQRITIHAGGEFPIDGYPKNIRLLPNVTFHSYAPSIQILPGLDARFELVQNNADRIYIKFGSALRIVKSISNGLATDAIVLNSKVDYNQFSIGLSYDVTISKLATANHGAGAFELGLTYQFGENHRKPYCPSF